MLGCRPDLGGFRANSGLVIGRRCGMLAAMPTRVFLGWDRPFSERAAAWLLERRERLPHTLVITPTAGAGRRLRELLAASAGALLSPRMSTPGALLRSVDEIPGTAPEWAEQVAWVETLESVSDWTPCAGLFPEPPEQGSGWANELAAEMVRLRRGLQENAHDLASAADRLRESVEADRWQALAWLEGQMEKRLAAWGMTSRSRRIADGIDRDDLPEFVVLAGVTELPPVVESALLKSGRDLVILTAAPESESETFSPTGIPLEDWNQRPLAWPDPSSGSVRLATDPRQQAAEAVACLSESGADSDEVALGSADDEVGAELVRALGSAGWQAFHPAARPAGGGLRDWLTVWARWLEDPALAVMADLLAFPQTGGLAGNRREVLSRRLAELRGRWLVQHADDIERRLATERFRSDADRESVRAVHAAAVVLETIRDKFSDRPFAAAMVGLLETVDLSDESDHDLAASLVGWLEEAGPVIGRVSRGAGFWLNLMLAAVPAADPVPPEDRVIDVQGWLELLYEPGRHLVICGMNDGKVPSRAGGDPWLGEAARSALGLPGESRRAARDAFLYQSMVSSRRDGGRVDLVLSKTGAGGEPLLPSRLLLAGTRDELPQRVALLFRDVEPPESGMRWQADWQWQPRIFDPPSRLSVTALRDYLACPFRFYLKHLAGADDPETNRVEWNARDFGNVAHTVLERWGEDTEAREFSKTEAINDWLSNELDRVVAAWFGKRVPLAVRIQTESLRQRLAWLARAQACERAAGWQIVDVERKVELAFGETIVAARIDRIDRHEKTGDYRVIDYKTGKIDRGVEGEHRTKVIQSSKLPPHIESARPVFFETQEKGKSATFRWINLQLPLYALALVRRGLPLPQPAYFGLGPTEDRVGLVLWDAFSQAELDSATACAATLVEMIRSRIFGPPVERVTYDDFRDLAAGRTMSEAVAPPFGQGDNRIP